MFPPQHFDTHDNIIFQIDGTKELYISHPNESQYMYMDHHDKYGLSPINVDRVDLQRYPAFAEAPPLYARVAAGDALFIPDGWWHLIRSHKRNIAVTFEMHPWDHQSQEALLPPEVRRRLGSAGVFWAESTRIQYAMRHKLAPSLLSAVTRRPFRCARPASVPLRLDRVELGGK